jgi:hypothetical protein
MPTLAEVDEALQHCRAVPSDERGAAWHAYVDSLLAQRADLLAHRPAFSHANQRETRVITAAETR